MPRKKPFSGKQKKEQMKAKKDLKRGPAQTHNARGIAKGDFSDSDDDAAESSKQMESEEVGESFTKQSEKSKVDRFKLDFQEETREEIMARRKKAMQPYSRLKADELEADVSLFYTPPVMIPVRPKWDYSLSVDQLEKQEQTYFREWWEEFRKGHTDTYCEKNLETWRQLWRVFEMSDMLLFIVDVRFTPLHFDPVVYDYVTNTLQKQMIVILNKCDVVPPDIAIAWKHYLLTKFPSLEVVIFTSYPKDESTRNALAKGKQSRRRRKKTPPVGPLDLWKVCNKLIPDDLDISEWKSKIEEDMRLESEEFEDSEGSDTEVTEGVEKAVPDLSYYKHQKYKDGVLTIGCIGYPNVGKSSVINALMGKKVVSVSRTPGHTKHFQTIFLTRNVRLCDCPGLVFPSNAPRPLQVVAGLYRIAQLREPFMCVQYIAERIITDLPTCLGIKLPSDEKSWSAFLICDVLAEQKGFMTAKGARTDPFRAANWILRAALEGKVLIYLIPPGLKDFRQKKWFVDEAKLFEQQQLDRIRSTQAPASDEEAVSKNARSSDEEEDDDSEPEETPPVRSRNAFDLLSNME